jgi:hypothetical protein
VREVTLGLDSENWYHRVAMADPSEQFDREAPPEPIADGAP